MGGLSDLTIAKISRVLQKHPEVEQGILYGSRALGTFRPGSDIDLTLHGDELNGDIIAKIASELDDLLLPQSIDLSMFKALDHLSLIEHINSVGVSLYRKKGG